MILKLIDIEVADELIVMMNAADARKLQVYSGERILISDIENPKRHVVAVLDILEKNIHMPDGEVDLDPGTLGLFTNAFNQLGVREGAHVDVKPVPRPESFDYVKAKAEGKRLGKKEFTAISQDIVDNVYSSADIAFFIAACNIQGMSLDETAAMCRAYVDTGSRLDFGRLMVVDKHCIGGIPGNRTTPIVVAIVSSERIVVPNNFTRSITSPAGTADVLENYLKIDLDVKEMYRVIKKVNACLVWGGSLNIAPADDLILEIEHPFNLDSENQMIAAILAKKIGAGNKAVLIDIPVGPEAKVKTLAKAKTLKAKFEIIGQRNKLNVKVIITDGTKPIGEGVGPILEMIDVINILKNDPAAPADLLQKSIELSAHLFLLARRVKTLAEGRKLSYEILQSGRAWQQFERIRTAQGKKNNLAIGKYKFDVKADRVGTIRKVSNKAIASLAKKTGAPLSVKAGLLLKKNVGDKVRKGEILYSLISAHPTRLKYAVEAAKKLTTHVIK